MTDRIGIDDVRPLSGDGTYPSKAVVGEHVPVQATVWREGHDAVAATVAWRGPGERRDRTVRMHEQGTGLDLFAATIVPDAPGLWTFRVDAWSDPWATAVHALEATRRDRRAEAGTLSGAAAALRDDTLPLGARVGPALDAAVRAVMHDHPVRQLLTRGPVRRVWVDRRRAAFGSWYELFPRSTGGVDADGRPVHGTLRTAADALDRVAAMQFDVVYLPPIHPIGRENRKGPNNTLTPGPDDVGSPWAIGAAEGGHDAIHPELGDDADFAAFVARAEELGLDEALERRPHLDAVALVVDLGAGDAEDAGVLGQVALEVAVVERGQQLAQREVAGAAEHGEVAYGGHGGRDVDRGVHGSTVAGLLDRYKHSFASF